MLDTLKVGDVLLVKDWNWQGEFVEIQTVTNFPRYGGVRTVNYLGVSKFIHPTNTKDILSIFPPATKEQAYFLGVGE